MVAHGNHPEKKRQASIGDGRLIPLLILETSERPDLEELIR